MPEKIYKVNEVFGINRDLPVNYVERPGIDEKLIDNLTRDHHIVIFGSSKQGKTCLRKHCLNDEDYVVVSCQHNMDLKQINAAILKSVGFEIRESTVRSVDGSHKIEAKLGAELGPRWLKFKSEAGGSSDEKTSEASTFRSLELDAQDPNDIIKALKDVGFTQLIVLEDFHYLPQETQQAFSYALKAFHENSKITFIIVAVWREENRLVLFNGDLTGRVIAIDADAWGTDQLMEVMGVGEALLNVQFSDVFKKSLIKDCFQSVYIVQEACHRACRDIGVNETQAKHRIIEGKRNASEYVAEIVNE